MIFKPLIYFFSFICTTNLTSIPDNVQYNSSQGFTIVQYLAKHFTNLDKAQLKIGLTATKSNARTRRSR